MLYREMKYKIFLEILTSVINDEKSTIPSNNYLFQNYPNPFNLSTTINYQVNKTGIVILRIYNILGKLVRTLVNREENPGYNYIKWDGKNDNNQIVTSGIYFYKLQAGTFMQSKKLILLK